MVFSRRLFVCVIRFGAVAWVAPISGCEFEFVGLCLQSATAMVEQTQSLSVRVVVIIVGYVGNA